MHIHVLGCHGADQLVGGTAGLVRQESCGFLIDGSMLLDAGTIGTRLTLAEQRRIRFVLLSHLLSITSRACRHWSTTWPKSSMSR